MAKVDFNMEEVEESKGWRVLPPGDYPATVVDTEVAPNKENTGMNFIPTFRIAAGEYEGQTIKTWWVWDHSNEKAKNIGRGKFKNLCKNTGLNAAMVEDTDELIDRPCVISITKRIKPDGSEGNDVRATLPASAYKKEQAAPAASEKPAQAAPEAAPWE